MTQYEIYIEEAESSEILEKNYMDLMISILASCIGEIDENEEGNNLSEGIDGGAS